MLCANIGLSRKLSKDYNSTGYSVNLDAEITAPISDSEAVSSRSRNCSTWPKRSSISRSTAPKARRPSPATTRARAVSPRQSDRQRDQWVRSYEPKPSPPQNGSGQEDQPATNKQIQYSPSIGKRQKLSKVQLEKKIADILGRPVDLRAEAGAIDSTN